MSPRVPVPLVSLLLFLAAPLAAEPPPPAELREGDRLVLLGGTLVERMQAHGYFQAELAARLPERGIVVRNLGWSGDNVWGESRALFGSRDDGFKRLVSDVKLAKPSVIGLVYGGNEAHAGEAGLESFKAGLNRLIEALSPTGARLLLLAPPPAENLGPPLPDPAEYNRNLERYREVLMETAEERGLPLIDLAALATRDTHEHWTENGRHFTPYGYWRLAPRLAQAFGAPERSWEVALTAEGKLEQAAGTAVSEIVATALGLRFTCRDVHLPPPSAPGESPAAARGIGGKLRVTGLPAGKYEIRAGDLLAATATHAELAAGIPFTAPPAAARVERLRQAVLRKDELFFHRYRPQNETYLFLFRKHEQGNNAVEIPQFDPLVEKQEAEIAKLARPEPYMVEIRIVEAEESGGR